jgi:prepilin-type N-terminal cleavage/methylation domain-containing protein
MGRHRALPARLSSDQGFTLAELLIAMVLGIIVLTTAVFVFTAGIHVQPRIQKRSMEIQQARTMSERMTRELRQGSNASVSAAGSQLMILTYVPLSTYCSTPATTGSSVARCRIFYSCQSAGSTSSCTRIQCPPAVLAVGTGCSSPTTVVSGLSTNQVFTFSPQVPGQAYVGVRLEYPAENGDDAITIQDGVALRNPPLGGP